MNTREVDAYNAGVLAVLDLARSSAAAMTARLVEKPTRYNFAAGAFAGLAEEGRALLLPTPLANSSTT